MEKNFDLRRVFVVMRKHWWAILLCTLGAAIIAFDFAAFAMPPKYTSSLRILVNQPSGTETAGTAYQDQQANVQMISTYKNLFSDRSILSKVKHNLGETRQLVRPAKKAVYRVVKVKKHEKRELVSAAEPAVYADKTAYDVSTKTLQNSISISNQQNSQVFFLNAEGTSPDEAAAIANVTASVFQARVKALMHVNELTIVSKVIPNHTKTSPKLGWITFAGLVVGFLIGLSYAVIRELRKTKVQPLRHVVSK